MSGAGSIETEGREETEEAKWNTCARVKEFESDYRRLFCLLHDLYVEHIQIMSKLTLSSNHSFGNN